jgi:SAM-dependent methyltransferase
MNKIFDSLAVTHKIAGSRSLVNGHYLAKTVADTVVEHLELNNQSFATAYVEGPEIPEIKRFVSGDIDHSFALSGELTMKYDLIVSTQRFHFINDIEAAILNFKNALKPGGLVLISFFGGNTFSELRTAVGQTDEELFAGIYPRLLPKVDLKDAARLIQKAGLKNPISDMEDWTVNYSSLANLQHDIKALALGNVLAARSNKYIGKAYFKRLEANLMNSATTFAITYSLVTAMGRL